MVGATRDEGHWQADERSDENGLRHRLRLVAKAQLAVSVHAPAVQLATIGQGQTMIVTTGDLHDCLRDERPHDPRHPRVPLALLLAQLAVAVRAPGVHLAPFR